MMQYPVLLSKKNGQYAALVPWLPDCAAQGRTRDEVLANLRTAIESTLADVEITTVEVQAKKQISSNV
jgi:predicted RNase H-like HicB family nuclease